MLNPKKHPLEIFRERGRHRPFVPSPGAPGSTPPQPGTEASLVPVSEVVDPKAMHPRWEPRPFELHLSLFGTLMVAMLWIVLLAGAYTLGVKRGSDHSRSLNDVNAKALGKQLEGGAEGAAPSATGDAAASRPANTPPPLYGVLLMTMPKNTSPDVWKAKLSELKTTLEKSYQIPRDQVSGRQLTVGGEFEYYVGKYESQDDPDLIGLRGKIRMIDDWPSGDKSPFRTAIIKPIPYVAPSVPSK